MQPNGLIFCLRQKMCSSHGFLLAIIHHLGFKEDPRQRMRCLFKKHATTDTVLTNRKLITKSQEYRAWQGQVFLHILHSFRIRFLGWVPQLHCCLTDSIIPECLDYELQFHIKKKEKKSLLRTTVLDLLVISVCARTWEKRTNQFCSLKSLCTVCWHDINVWVSSPLPTGNAQHLLHRESSRWLVRFLAKHTLHNCLYSLSALSPSICCSASGR